LVAAAAAAAASASASASAAIARSFDGAWKRRSLLLFASP
jgi:hypothetical protein